jgi:hypothetical protein
MSITVIRIEKQTVPMDFKTDNQAAQWIALQKKKDKPKDHVEVE